MVQNPPEGYERVTPYLLYEDGLAALEFLSRAFGFTERLTMKDADGHLGHAEMVYEGSVVMLGSPGGDYQSPSKTGSNSILVHVYVDDVDAHFATAKREGADIDDEPTDMPYGDRSYSAKDLEGHSWTFAQHIKDVDPNE